jgi:hypothetical protein
MPPAASNALAIATDDPNIPQQPRAQTDIGIAAEGQGRGELRGGPFCHERAAPLFARSVAVQRP